MASKKTAKKKSPTIPLPPAGDWRTTDRDEILRRVQRARDEKHSVSNLHPGQPVFSTFAVKSPSGMVYQVEIRDIRERAFSCTCPDFRTAGLGTCKHIEATLIRLKRSLKGDFRLAEIKGSPFMDLVPHGDTLRIERNFRTIPSRLRPMFGGDGILSPSADLDEALGKLRRHPKIRVSQDVDRFLENRRFDVSSTASWSGWSDRSRRDHPQNTASERGFLNSESCYVSLFSVTSSSPEKITSTKPLESAV